MKMLGSPPPHEHIKNTLTHGATLAENKDDWQKGSSITRIIKKDLQGPGKEERRSNQVRMQASSRGYRRWGGYHRLGNSLWEVRGSGHYWKTQPWDLILGRQAPLAGLKISGAYQKAVRNWDYAPEGHMHRFACSLSKHGGSRLKTARCYGWLAWATPVQPSACNGLLHQHYLLWYCSLLRERAPLPEECTQLEKMEAAEAPVQPLARVETIIVIIGMSVSTWEGKNPAQ